MKEYRIILATVPYEPVKTGTARDQLRNSGLAEAHVWLRRAILTNFDGLTSYEATGAWRNDNGEIDREPVVIYDIAIEDNAVCDRILRELAITACERAREDCVYFRDGDGNVELLRPPYVCPAGITSACKPSPAFPRKGGGTYRALDPVLHEDEARTRTQIRDEARTRAAISKLTRRALALQSRN